MMEYIWEPLLPTLAMLICSAVGYLFLVIAHRNTKSKPTPEKTRTYACGEVLKPEELHPDSAGFFSPVKKVIRPFYQKIGSAHSGELNKYLMWMVSGLLVLFVVILLMVVTGWA